MSDGTDEKVSTPTSTPTPAPAPAATSDPQVVPSASEAWRDAPFHAWAWRAAVGDLAAAVAAAVLATLVRFGADPGHEPVRIPYWLLGLVVVVAWPLLAAACGAYELRTALFGVEELRRVIRTGIFLLAALGLAHFMFRLDLSRGYVASLVPLLVVLTATWRTILRERTGRRMKLGRDRHRVALVGPVAELVHLCAQIQRRGASAIRIVAIVADDLDESDEVPESLRGLRRVPSRDALRQLRASGVQVDLLVRAGRPQPDELWILARRAYELGAAMAIAPRRHDAASNMAVSYVPLFETPLLMVETPSMRAPARAGKWVFDKVCAVVGIVLLAPVLLGIAVAIRLRDGRPVLFRQERVGRNGRTFQCVKFRTMTNDALSRLEELAPLNEAESPLFKIRNDPRITPLGRRLRRRSLDEMPQLFHVLTGKMSIVGPRPPLPSEAATYDERAARRLLVKPGMTGLWQVRGRSNLPWDEGLYLDLLYVDHWSPILDLMIIARTVREVVRPRGAY